MAPGTGEKRTPGIIPNRQSEPDSLYITLSAPIVFSALPTSSNDYLCDSSAHQLNDFNERIDSKAFAGILIL